MTDDRLFDQATQEGPVEGFGELVFAFVLTAMFWAVLAYSVWAGAMAHPRLSTIVGGLLAMAFIWALARIFMPKLVDEDRPLQTWDNLRKALIAPLALAMPVILFLCYMTGHALLR